MDPLALIHSTVTAAKILHEIRITCKESSGTLLSMEMECRIFESNIRYINDWLGHASKSPSPQEQAHIESLKNALTLIGHSMQRLNNDLRGVQHESKGGMGISSQWGVKAKYVWKEDLMKAHLDRLRHHANTVSFTLQVLQLRKPDSAGRDLQQAAIEASSTQISRTSPKVKRSKRHSSVPQNNQLMITHNEPLMIMPAEPRTGRDSVYEPPAYQEMLPLQETGVVDRSPAGTVRSSAQVARGGHKKRHGRGFGSIVLSAASLLLNVGEDEAMGDIGGSLDMPPGDDDSRSSQGRDNSSSDHGSSSSDNEDRHQSRKHKSKKHASSLFSKTSTHSEDTSLSRHSTTATPTPPKLHDAPSQSFAHVQSAQSQHPQTPNTQTPIAHTPSAETPSAQTPSAQTLSTHDQSATVAQIHSSIRRKPIDPNKRQNRLPSTASMSQLVSTPETLSAIPAYMEMPTNSAPPDILFDSTISSPTDYFGPSRQSSILSTSTSEMVIGQTCSTSLPVSPLEPAGLSFQSMNFDINTPDQEGFPLVVRASRDGLEDMARKVLASHANIEAVHTKTKRTALIEASRGGHERVIDLLTRRGCSVDVKDAETMTALHHAATNGHVGIAEQLLAYKANIDMTGPKEQTPLHLAAEGQHTKLVMLLLQRHANVNARDASQSTALHVSASKGNLVVCTELLDRGAQLESGDANLKTPLQLAAECGHLEVVEIFITRSNLKVKDASILGAFFAAVEGGNTRVVQTFLNKGVLLKKLKDDSYKPSTLAAKSGNLAMLDLMIANKCRIKDKEKDANSWTALHFAAHHGHAAIIDRLLEKDLSNKATTSKKETALHLAVKANNFVATEALLRSKGIPVNAKESQGQEAIHFAVRNGNVGIANLLLSNNAKTDAENSFGWQPLHIAVAYGHKQLVEQLLDKGANIEEKLGKTSYKKSDTHTTVENGYWAEARWPYFGSTPLHLAIEYDRNDIAELLVGKGAKIEAQCSEFWRPLHTAAFCGNPTMVEQLLNRGAHVHALTAEGKSPMALQFRTSEPLITETNKERVRELLERSMAATPKQTRDQLKNAFTFGGKKVDDKNEMLKSAAFARGVLTRQETVMG